jgi:hypothetical protein
MIFTSTLPPRKYAKHARRLYSKVSTANLRSNAYSAARKAGWSSYSSGCDSKIAIELATSARKPGVFR